MTDEEYPAIYQAADRAAIRAQSTYLRCIIAYACLAISGAGFAVYGIYSKPVALFAAALLLIGMFVSLLMVLKKYEDVWYRGRAVAESIKTSTWRYMLRAEPFVQEDLDDAKVRLRNMLARVLQEHKDLGSELAGEVAGKTQITERMNAIRQSTFQERLAVYLEERVREQRAWYVRKSTLNVVHGRRWFWVFLALQGFAVGFTLGRVAWPEWHSWPVQVFVVAGTSALGWIQVKRYRELGSAYAIAAHEIGFAENDAERIDSELSLAEYVAKTENAFSKEHTQWVVRET